MLTWTQCHVVRAWTFAMIFTALSSWPHLLRKFFQQQNDGTVVIANQPYKKSDYRTNSVNFKSSPILDIHPVHTTSTNVTKACARDGELSVHVNLHPFLLTISHVNMLVARFVVVLAQCRSQSQMGKSISVSTVRPVAVGRPRCFCVQPKTMRFLSENDQRCQ